jgi:hypothetical protein
MPKGGQSKSLRCEDHHPLSISFFCRAFAQFALYQLLSTTNTRLNLIVICSLVQKEVHYLPTETYALADDDATDVSVGTSASASV